MAAIKEANEAVNDLGYRAFTLGGFRFERDEYFAHIQWPGGSHLMPVDRFLLALMRDVAWNFFYGIVNFDEVFGTVNHYGTVEVFAGLFNAGYRNQNRHYTENFDGDLARLAAPVPAHAALFQHLLRVVDHRRIAAQHHL